jgi:hypothetical protein
VSTKKQREQAKALENIRDALAEAGPLGGGTLLIIDDGGRPSSSGRTHCLEIHLLENKPARRYEPSCRIEGNVDEYRPQTTLYLTINVATLLGYRLNKSDQIIMGGYGYSRPHHIAEALAWAAGHPLYFDSLGAGIGNVRGWIGKAREASAAE